MDWLLSGSELISVWWKEARVNTTSATQRRYRSLRRMPVWGWRDGCWLLFPSTRVRSLTPTCWLTPVYNSSPGDLKASSGTRQEGEHGHPCNQSTHTLKKERKKKTVSTVAVEPRTSHQQTCLAPLNTAVSPPFLLFYLWC